MCAEENRKLEEQTYPKIEKASPPTYPKIEKASPPSVALTRRGFDPQNYEEACLFAKALAESSQLVPPSYHGKPGDCIIALDLAARLDAPWLTVMQHVYTVHGRPAMDAALSTALVNRSGRFVDPLEYEVQGEKATNGEYRVRAFAKCSHTGKVLYGPWIDWPLVKAEGWYDKPGSKWKTMPEQMFHYRAASWFQRRYCPELTMGMLTTDEAADLPESPISVEDRDVITEKGINGLKARLGINENEEQDKSVEPKPSITVPSPIEKPAYCYNCKTEFDAAKAEKVDAGYPRLSYKCTNCGRADRTVVRRYRRQQVEIKTEIKAEKPIINNKKTMDSTGSPLNDEWFCENCEEIIHPIFMVVEHVEVPGAPTKTRSKLECPICKSHEPDIKKI